MSPARVLIRDRRTLPFLVALAAAGASWGALGWCVVLAKPVSWLPLQVVWGAFALFGVALPVLLWNRTAVAEVVDGRLRIGGARPVEVPLEEVQEVAADDAHGRLALRLADGRQLSLRCARPTEFAEGIRTGGREV